MQDALGSNPDTHKAGDSPKAAVGTFLYPHRTVTEIDTQNASGRTQAGAGVDHPPFCRGTHRSEHQLHAASANGEASHDHAR